MSQVIFTKGQYSIIKDRYTTADKLIHEGMEVYKWKRGNRNEKSDVLDPELYLLGTGWEAEEVEEHKKMVVGWEIDENMESKKAIVNKDDLGPNQYLFEHARSYKLFVSRTSVAKTIVGISFNDRNAKSVKTFTKNILPNAPAISNKWEYIMYITSDIQDKEFVNSFKDNGWAEVITYQNWVHAGRPNTLWVIRSDGTTPEVETEQLIGLEI